MKKFKNEKKTKITNTKCFKVWQALQLGATKMIANWLIYELIMAPQKN